MRCLIITLLLSLVMLFIFTGCGLHLQNTSTTQEVPNEFKVLILSSNDPYSPLIYAIKQQLRRLSNINLINKNKNLQNTPILKIIDSFEHTKTISVYQNGKSAEKEFSFLVNAQIILPNNIIYQIRTHVKRSFFDNPSEILTRDTENEFIKQKIYEQSARQLIHKLLIIYNIISNKSIA